MIIVIPMAGSGQRFVDVGYTDPKPAILVDKKKIVEYVIDVFAKQDKFIFICNENQKDHPTLIPTLNNLRAQSDIIVIPSHKKGPVYTVIPAFDSIDDDQPVIVAYCDGTVKFNYEHFKKYVIDNDLDGCIFTHTGFHPHTLSKTKMAFIKEENGQVLEVKEKAHYTDNPQNEHASSGVYYFKSGAILKKYFRQAIDENLNYNGEHYITLVYNLLVRDSLKVGFYDTEYVLILGTPEEVDNYKAWLTIVRNTCIKNNEDLIKLYEYWKGFLL